MVLTIGNSHKKGAWWRVIGWRNKAVEGPAGQSYYSRIAEIVSLSAREAVIAHCVLNARNVAREPPAETWREPIPFWLEVSRQSGANRLPRQLASFHRSERRGFDEDRSCARLLVGERRDAPEHQTIVSP